MDTFIPIPLDVSQNFPTGKKVLTRIKHSAKRPNMLQWQLALDRRYVPMQPSRSPCFSRSTSCGRGRGYESVRACAPEARSRLNHGFSHAAQKTITFSKRHLLLVLLLVLLLLSLAFLFLLLFLVSSFLVFLVVIFLQDAAECLCPVSVLLEPKPCTRAFECRLSGVDAPVRGRCG